MVFFYYAQTTSIVFLSLCLIIGVYCIFATPIAPPAYLLFDRVVPCHHTQDHRWPNYYFIHFPVKCQKNSSITQHSRALLFSKCQSRIYSDLFPPPFRRCGSHVLELGYTLQFFISLVECLPHHHVVFNTAHPTILKRPLCNLVWCELTR